MKLYKRGEIFWIYYWDRETKKKIRISTGETEEAKARSFMLRQFAPVMGAEMRDRLAAAAKVSKDELKKLREEEGVRALLKDVQVPTLREDGAPLAVRTVQLNVRTWRLFVQWCENEKNIRATAQVTREMAREFIGAAPSLDTRRHMRNALYRIFSVMGYDAESNPFRGPIPRLPGDIEVHRQPLPPEGVTKLLKHAVVFGGPEFGMYIRALIYTGLRMGDCATLTTQNILYDIWFVERVMAKTLKKVRFPVHRSLKKYFLEMQPTRGPLFPQIDGLYRHSPNYMSMRVKDCLRTAGVIPENALRGEYCAHCLRTTFASLCCTAGVPLPVIQDWLGHTSQEVTRIYAQFTDDQLKREAIERIPDL